MNTLKIKKGDKVVVLTGKDKGKTGDVVRVLPKESRVVVEGVAVAKRHIKSRGRQSGSIVERPASVHVSNVALVDPSEKKATRVGRKTVDGKNVRFAKKSGTVLK